MFEDSTFESNGRIRTRSRRWMLATLALNGGLLLALVLIPLVYPQALPRVRMPWLVAVPETPPEPKPQPRPVPQVFHGQREMVNGQIFAPPKIPTGIARYAEKETDEPVTIAAIGGPGGADGSTGIFSGTRKPPVVHVAPDQKVRVAGTVAAGLLIYRKLPVYPELARAMRMEGTVVLAATISKAGTIENLHVVSGPAVLQQAALDAVKAWRYRPYLLDGEPVQVETTVNVIFTLGR